MAPGRYQIKRILQDQFVLSSRKLFSNDSLAFCFAIVFALEKRRVSSPRLSFTIAFMLKMLVHTQPTTIGHNAKNRQNPKDFLSHLRLQFNWTKVRNPEILSFFVFRLMIKRMSASRLLKCINHRPYKENTVRNFEGAPWIKLCLTDTKAAISGAPTRKTLLHHKMQETGFRMGIVQSFCCYSNCEVDHQLKSWAEWSAFSAHDS